MKNIMMIIAVSAFLSYSAAAAPAVQDSVKNKAKKGMVVLKIEKDDNGKTTVIDTAFNISTPEGQKAFEAFMQKNEKSLDRLGKELKEIEMTADVPDLPDSLFPDSLVKQFKFYGGDMRCPHFSMKDLPEEYEYEIEMPGVPDFDFPPSRDYEDVERDFRPERDMKYFRYNDHRQTLSDVIGDIPMDRVRNYSIKDTKHGKRIVIDVDDAPLVQGQDRVIILENHGGNVHKQTKGDRQVKVIIKSDEDSRGNAAGTPEQPKAPAPGK